MIITNSNSKVEFMQKYAELVTETEAKISKALAALQEIEKSSKFAIISRGTNVTIDIASGEKKSAGLLTIMSGGSESFVEVGRSIVKSPLDDDIKERAKKAITKLEDSKAVCAKNFGGHVPIPKDGNEVWDDAKQESCIKLMCEITHIRMDFVLAVKDLYNKYKEKDTEEQFRALGQNIEKSCNKLNAAVKQLVKDFAAVGMDISAMNNDMAQVSSALTALVGEMPSGKFLKKSAPVM